MDFLESAAILVPALTGMALTRYDGDAESLKQFEAQYCFTPQLQNIYTVQGLETFFREHSKNQVYALEEPMGTHLVTFKVAESWVLLGPYVEDAWNERAAQLLLAELNATGAVLPMYKAYRCKMPIVSREFAVRTAFLLSENIGHTIQMVEVFRVGSAERSPALTFSDVYANASEINRRYQMQEQFVSAISQGDLQKAYWAFREASAVSIGIQFMSEHLKDQLAGATIVRTLVRDGGIQAGLSPVIVDSISQEYAQLMRCAVSKEELYALEIRLIERFCAEAQEQRKAKYSPTVRRAIDYISINLSKPMSTEEIARAGEEKYRSFVRQFEYETGMTVKEYLTEKRCTVAAELLLSSDASIQEIAAYVGYPDNSYFSRVFKTTKGVTPLDYRQLHRNNSPDKKF